MHFYWILCTKDKSDVWLIQVVSIHLRDLISAQIRCVFLIIDSFFFIWRTKVRKKLQCKQFLIRIEEKNVENFPWSLIESIGFNGQIQRNSLFFYLDLLWHVAGRVRLNDQFIFVDCGQGDRPAAATMLHLIPWHSTIRTRLFSESIINHKNINEFAYSICKTQRLLWSSVFIIAGKA